MKEIPILFSTSMVQAILAGRKTQTRRLMDPQPATFITALSWGKHVSHCPEDCSEDQHVKIFFNDKSKWQAGDILWVRETWRGVEQDFGAPRIEYKATEKINTSDKWRPSIFMPKPAARIWLQVDNVRVERLKEISEDDAIAEGVEKVSDDPFPWKHYGDCNTFCSDARTSFRSLWEEINGFNSWQANPWVFAISFKVLSTTGRPDYKQLKAVYG